MSTPHPVECQTCHGSGFFDDIGQAVGHAYNSVKGQFTDKGSALREGAKMGLSMIPGGGSIASAAADAVGLGKPAKKVKRTRKGGISESMQRRNAEVKRLMKEEKMSLPKASAHLKTTGWK